MKPFWSPRKTTESYGIILGPQFNKTILNSGTHFPMSLKASSSQVTFFFFVPFHFWLFTFSSMNMSCFYNQEYFFFKLYGCCRKLNCFMMTRFGDECRWKQMASSVVALPGDLFTTRDYQSTEWPWLLHHEIIQDSRNLTDKQMCFPSQVVLFLMKWLLRNQTIIITFLYLVYEMTKVIKSENSN